MKVPRRIMRNYIERRNHDLQVCLSCFEQEKYSDIEKIAHRLKGSGTTFGHPEISEIGSSLEWAARKTDVQSIQIILNHFLKWISQWN